MSGPTKSMALVSLGIRNVRNLRQVDIAPSPDLNLILGENGAGKTSVLEALYLLGRGRSFRTAKIERVVGNDGASLTVTGRVEEEGRTVPLGIERGRQVMRLRVGGSDASGMAQLAQTFPVQLIQPNSHRLLEEGPRYRRQFLDWGVFHVEPGFYPAWQRFQRALRQRNASLRARQDETPWTPELIAAASAIDEARRRYLEMLIPRVLACAEELLGTTHLTLRYSPGWPQGQDLSGALAEHQRRDREQGFTVYGPHRADLRVQIDGTAVAERVSRGQQKMLVAAMVVAQAALFQAQTGRSCALLVDDVAAELDRGHRTALLTLLGKLPLQLFVTAIEDHGLLVQFPRPAKVFHVEHGAIQEVV